MYASLRHYRIEPKNMDELVRRVPGAMEVMSKLDGFRAYYVVRAGDDTLVRSQDPQPCRPFNTLNSTTAVERDVPPVRRLQIGRQPFAIEPRKRIPHQRVAVAPALMGWIHSDERQVPVRLFRVVRRHLLENCRTRLPSSR